MIQEGQKHHPPNLDPKTAIAEKAKQKSRPIYHCFIEFQEGFRLYQPRRHMGDIEVLWNWPKLLQNICEHSQSGVV